eukprot:7377984-Pyramimonas_sp.AAC.1
MVRPKRTAKFRLDLRGTPFRCTSQEFHERGYSWANVSPRRTARSRLNLRGTPLRWTSQQFHEHGYSMDTFA